MKIKKNPKANLEHYSKVFALLGLVLSLYVSYVFIEHKTYAAPKPDPIIDTVTLADTFDTPTYIQIEPEVPQQKVEAHQEITEPVDATTVEDPTLVEIVPDKTAVTDIIFEDTSDKEPTEDEILDILEGDDFVEVEKNAVETVGFISSVTAPVFPGCEKYVGKKEKAKKCFNKKIAKFFGKNFDTGIAEEAGLTGVQKITCVFIINNKGEIAPEIKTSRTENIVSDEIKEVIKKLPKMKPATQNGRAVNLIYALPVKFSVE